MNRAPASTVQGAGGMLASGQEAVRAKRAELRALRKEMRANGVRKISPFNGGLTSAESRYNSERFRLETELERLQTA